MSVFHWMPFFLEKKKKKKSVPQSILFGCDTPDVQLVQWKATSGMSWMSLGICGLPSFNHLFHEPRDLLKAFLSPEPSKTEKGAPGPLMVLSGPLGLACLGSGLVWVYKNLVVKRALEWSTPPCQPCPQRSNTRAPPGKTKDVSGRTWRSPWLLHTGRMDMFFYQTVASRPARGDAWPNRSSNKSRDSMRHVLGSIMGQRGWLRMTMARHGPDDDGGPWKSSNRCNTLHNTIHYFRWFQGVYTSEY